MMDWMQQLPHLEAYGNPQYFVYVVGAVLPIFFGLFYGRRFPFYEGLVQLVFLLLMVVGKTNHQLFSLVAYLLWQLALVYGYWGYRQRADRGLVFYLAVFLLVLPLSWVKVAPAILGHQSLFGFLGISYMTFRSVGVVIELRDGSLKEVEFLALVRFLLFLPTFSSGPIDRYKRFTEDYKSLPNREELLDLLEVAISSIMRGMFYKFILAYVIGQHLLAPLKQLALATGGVVNLPTLGVMYLFGLELFFDFAGYSLFALGVASLMGIRCPINFDRPFLSRDMKEFWNRWHMSLSFWFRDYVFMRLVKVLLKNKVFSSRHTTSSVAYLVNMLVMGLWHGVTWYYIAYGLFHGLCLVLNDAWLRKKKEINQKRKKEGRHPLPENGWTRALGTIVTVHAVLLSFLIFSGFLDKLWFTP